MKKGIFLLGAGILLAASMQAQTQIFLDEQDIGLPDGVSTAWVFPIAGEIEEALDDLKEYSKERSDVKMKRGGDNLLIAEKVAVPVIAQKRGDLVGFAYDSESIRSMALVFQLGYDISLNSEEWATEMENLRIYSKAFLSYHFEQEYVRRMKVLEKEIKALEKEKNQEQYRINNLTKKINNLSKKIGKETETSQINSYEAEIRTYEADLKELMDLQPGLDAKLTQLKNLVDQNRAESHNNLTAIGAL